MNLQKRCMLVILLLTGITAAKAQLFHPLGLNPYADVVEEGMMLVRFCPRLHLEGDTLFACTGRGLYAKDLSKSDGAWEPAGFADEPLMDYVRRGSDILALRCSEGGHFLLLSHDGGSTFEEVTSASFPTDTYGHLAGIAQHPTAPDTLLIAFKGQKLLRSGDFGKTWEDLGVLVSSGVVSLGYHPENPNIFYSSGETNMMIGFLYVTYNAGNSWDDNGNIISNGDNCVHRIAFCPGRPERWIFGGEGVVGTSDDNGQTWEILDLYTYGHSYGGYWYYTVYDEEQPDTIYMAGFKSPTTLTLMCSTDGGATWGDIIEKQLSPIEPWNRGGVFDLLQYKDQLLVYTSDDVYEISKAELLEASTTWVRPAYTNKEGTSPTFDLYGRMCNPTRGGLYIRDGRKVVVK